SAYRLQQVPIRLTPHIYAPNVIAWDISFNTHSAPERQNPAGHRLLTTRVVNKSQTISHAY
ncbi:hypothetical protein, partial [Cryobacterium sp. M91]|uniref:hypothetical protein n=1 Tax=Cryobacterium sp. M91 TaxID=2048294 RepID=UPI001E53AE5A